MPSLGEIILEVLPSAKGFSTALRAEMAPAMAQAEGQVAASSKGITGAFNKMGTAAKVGLGVAAFAAVDFGKKSVDAFLESEAATTELNHAVEKSPRLSEDAAKAFEEQAHALQGLTGFQDEAIIGADTILSRFGLTQQQLEDAIPVVLDFARATGRDVPDAAKAVGKALLGNARALKDVGVDFTATGNKAADFKSILDILTQQVGGTAKAFGQTAAGQLEIAKAKFNDLEEAVGKGLVPALTAILDAASPLIGVLTKLAPILPEIAAGFVAWKLAMKGAALSEAAAGATGLGAAISGVTGTLLAFAPAVAAAALALPILSKSFESAKDTATRLELPTDWIERANKEWAFFTTHYRGNLREMFAGSVTDIQSWAKAAGYSTDQVNKAISGNIDKLGGWSGGFDEFKAAAEGALQAQEPLGPSATAIGSAAEEAAQATEHQAEAEQRAADAAKALYTAELGLAGGLLGLESNALAATDAQNQLKDANAAVAKLAAQGKKGTKDYATALEAQDKAALGATQSQLSLVKSVQDYVAENHGSKASTAEAIALVRQYGKDAGLTSGQVQHLVGEVTGLIGTYGRVPDSVSTDVHANNLTATRADIDGLIAHIHDIDGSSADVYVYTHHVDVYGSSHHGGIQTVP